MVVKNMVWKVKGKGKPVVEVWEDFYGNLWFITEKDAGDGLSFGYARLYHMPDCAEWGYMSWDEIEQAVGKGRVWKVNERAWSNIVSYEDGLLLEV